MTWPNAPERPRAVDRCGPLKLFAPQLEQPAAQAGDYLRRGGELTRERAGVVVDVLSGEPIRTGIPGEVDDDVEFSLPPGRSLTLPRAALRAAHGRDLDHTLRADDDVLEVEPHVRKGAKEARIEGARAGVPFPALAGGDDLVDAVLGQRGDEPVEVAAILGLRVRDPETPNLRIELGRDVPRETLADRRRSFGHRMTVPRNATAEPRFLLGAPWPSTVATP